MNFDEVQDKKIFFGLDLTTEATLPFPFAVHDLELLGEVVPSLVDEHEGPVAKGVPAHAAINGGTPPTYDRVVQRDEAQAVVD